MSQHPPIRLSYFDARARAQFIRAFLAAREIPYEDERVPLDEGFASWMAIRPDRARSGPLQRLPLLHYGDDLIPEGLVIANFLHEVTGDATALGREADRRHAVLLSAGYTDLLMQIAMTIWADLMYPGVDLAKAVASNFGRIQRTLGALDVALADWGWVDAVGDRPVMLADCLLWELLDQAQVLFGPALDLAATPTLERLYVRHPARQTFESLLARKPAQITGRPAEAAAIAEIRKALAAS